jgi:hypothetical protein
MPLSHFKEQAGKKMKGQKHEFHLRLLLLECDRWLTGFRSGGPSELQPGPKGPGTQFIQRSIAPDGATLLAHQTWLRCEARGLISLRSRRLGTSDFHCDRKSDVQRVSRQKDEGAGTWIAILESISSKLDANAEFSTQPGPEKDSANEFNDVLFLRRKFRNMTIGMGERIAGHYRQGALTTSEFFALIVFNFDSWGRTTTTHLTDAEREQFIAWAEEIRSPGQVLLISSVGEYTVSVQAFEALQQWINRNIVR